MSLDFNRSLMLTVRLLHAMASETDPRCAEDAQVTPECKDLLVRLLVADPERRMSMEEIKAHTWFSHALPTGALHMNDWYMSHPSGIDEVRVHHHNLAVTLHAHGNAVQPL